jgi:hypothetical protein
MKPRTAVKIFPKMQCLAEVLQLTSRFVDNLCYL